MSVVYSVKDAVPAPLGWVEADIPSSPRALLRVRDLDFFYGNTQALHGIHLDISPKQVTALIGPSGCGKSTLLRCFNRINELIDGARITRGSVHLGEVDIYSRDVDVIALRRKVGMVFQKYNPFPRSIFENAAYGLEVAGIKNKAEIAERVESSLRDSTLWDEVKDRLHESALGLSGGQQQRLCIARALAVKPEVILMDEPCSALDPIATARIEELILQLREQYTIIIVTHNMEQAARVSQKTAFFYLGRMVEYNDTGRMFLKPDKPETERYITGQMG